MLFYCPHLAINIIKHIDILIKNSFIHSFMNIYKAIGDLVLTLHFLSHLKELRKSFCLIRKDNDLSAMLDYDPISGGFINVTGRVGQIK